MPTGLPSQWCLPACPFMSKTLTTYHTVCLCTLYVLMYIIMYTYWICYACIMWVHYTLHYTTLSKCCTFTWAICGEVVLPVYILYNTHLVRHQLGMGIVQHILNLFCSEVLLNCMMDRGRGEGVCKGDEQKKWKTCWLRGLCQLHIHTRWGKVGEMVGGEGSTQRRRQGQTMRPFKTIWQILLPPDNVMKFAFNPVGNTLPHNANFHLLGQKPYLPSASFVLRGKHSIIPYALKSSRDSKLLQISDLHNILYVDFIFTNAGVVYILYCIYALYI